MTEALTTDHHFEQAGFVRLLKSNFGIGDTEMLFALDFDGTFDRDPELFRKLVELLRSHGHSVVCITSRFQGFSDEVELAVGDMPILYAGDVWKRQAARAAGYHVHVWIEDLPEYVDRQDPEFAAQKLDSRIA